VTTGGACGLCGLHSHRLLAWRIYRGHRGEIDGPQNVIADAAHPYHHPLLVILTESALVSVP
jgi:hypothetical protein